MARSSPKTSATSRKQGIVLPSEVQSGALASLLGVTQRQIANLAKEGMPHDGERYQVSECVQWYIRRRAAESKPADERRARARKLDAEAENAELDLLERRRELIPREVHEMRCEKFAQRLFGAVTGQLPSLMRIEFEEFDPITLQVKVERIGDGLIAACLESADDIEEPPSPSRTGDDAIDEVREQEELAWAERGGVSG